MQGARLLQREAGATQGYIGGAGSVPAGAQIRTPGLALTPGSDAARGAELGLIGMNRQGQDLFTQAIMAGEMRSQADFDRQRINLAAQIEADARAAQRERVSTEEARAKNFEQTAMQTMISNILSANNKVAELQAAAAASDNRTDKEKLLLEAKREQQRADIEAAKQIKIGKALAKSSGATTEAQNAALQSAILTTGASTYLGRVSSNSEKNMSFYKTSGPEQWLATPITGQKGKGNVVTAGGNSNSRWVYRDGILTQYPTGDVTAPGEAIDVRSTLTDITYKAGQLQGVTNEKQRLDQWDAFFRGFSPAQRAALAVIYRQPDAAKSTWYHGYIVPAKPTTKK
jgi:hypothetical protein